MEGRQNCAKVQLIYENEKELVLYETREEGLQENLHHESEDDRKEVGKSYPQFLGQDRLAKGKHDQSKCTW